MKNTIEKIQDYMKLRTQVRQYKDTFWGCEFCQSFMPGNIFMSDSCDIQIPKRRCERYKIGGWGLFLLSCYVFWCAVIGFVIIVSLCN